jgi:sec-independent protein translocase protein TatB
MFEIDFSKIAVIAVVALLVLGPERLPRVARMAGALVRRARASWMNVRTEIERELAAEDLRQSLQEARRAADVREDVRAAAAEVEDAFRAAPPASAPVTPPPPDERA